MLILLQGAQMGAGGWASPPSPPHFNHCITLGLGLGWAYGYGWCSVTHPTDWVTIRRRPSHTRKTRYVLCGVCFTEIKMDSLSSAQVCLVPSALLVSRFLWIVADGHYLFSVRRPSLKTIIVCCFLGSVSNSRSRFRIFWLTSSRGGLSALILGTV